MIEELYALPVKRPGSSLEAPSCWRHSSLPWLTVMTQGFGSGLLYALWRSTFAAQTPGAACGCAVACAKPRISQPVTMQGWDDLLRRENQARRGVVDSHLVATHPQHNSPRVKNEYIIVPRDNIVWLEAARASPVNYFSFKSQSIVMHGF